MTLLLDDFVRKDTWETLREEVEVAAKNVIDRATPTFDDIVARNNTSPSTNTTNTIANTTNTTANTTNTTATSTTSNTTATANGNTSSTSFVCEEGVSVSVPGVVTECEDPEVHVDGGALKFFETNGQKSASTVGFYVRMPIKTGTGAMEHENRGESKLWKDVPLFDHFPLMKKFIYEEVLGNVLTEIGRVWLIYDSSGNDGIKHTDHSIDGFRSEFLWIRIGRSKTIAVRSGEEEEPQPLEGYACWFDSRFEHQAICLDPSTPAISLRIDGYFTDKVRERLSSYPSWSGKGS
eukprot:m.39076 g.39076  ORF g.39076 m.39076 type:complete len:293 (+) comp10262_c0_seq3:88-966(+)